MFNFLLLFFIRGGGRGVGCGERCVEGRGWSGVGTPRGVGCSKHGVGREGFFTPIRAICLVDIGYSPSLLYIAR